ncbi:MAG: hypothetical protein AAGB32_00895 [Pseudomonadota bacterium]
MARPKNQIAKETVLGVFQHFGRQPDDVKRPFMKSAGLKVSDMRSAATSGCLPAKSGWKKIITAAKANGWEGP